MGVLGAVLWTAVAFSPNGKWIVGGGAGELRIWEAATNKLERKIEGLTGQARAISFRPDGRTLAVATGAPGRSGALVLVDFATGVTTKLADSKDEMLAAVFNADGVWLAYGGTDGRIAIWSVDEHRLIATLEDQPGWVRGLSFSPDGKYLASNAGVWETTTWKNVVRFSFDANAVAFSPDSDYLAIAAEDHAIRVWRPQNPAANPRTIDTGACVPLGITSVRARLFAACSDQTVRVLGPAGNTFFTLSGHADWVYAIAATPDGGRFASGAGDGTVRVWASSGKAVATLQ